MQFTLISHPLCPYVQRAAIVLMEKNVPFTRRWVDLADKPGWFLAISPLGKTPVLLADDAPLFESAVICEYLDETHRPPLHPSDPLQRAQHRGWVEFSSSVLNVIGGYYSASDATALQVKRAELDARLGQLESILDPAGPYFAGAGFSLVDAAFAPVFRYLEVFEHCGQGDFLADLPRMRAWQAALAARDSVRRAAPEDYPQRLTEFLRARGSELSRRIRAADTWRLRPGRP